MKKTKTRLAILALLGLLTVCAWPKTEWQTLQVKGEERRYFVEHPPLVAGHRYPLILALHGGGGTAQGIARWGFSRLARERGYIVVFPQGIEKHWYDERVQFTTKDGKRPDDVAFLSELLDQAEHDYPVDPRQVYVAGVSNGAIMSHLLAEKLGKKLTGIIPIIGGITEEQAAQFAPKAPLSVMIIQGDADPIVPFQGGPITVLGKKRGNVLPTEETVKKWVETDGCQKRSEDKLPDSDPTDGCRVTCTIYGGGHHGTQVWYYRVSGGGHTVPGGLQYLPERMVGKVCRDIDAMDLIDEFCRRTSARRSSSRRYRLVV